LITGERFAIRALGQATCVEVVLLELLQVARTRAKQLSRPHLQTRGPVIARQRLLQLRHYAARYCVIRRRTFRIVVSAEKEWANPADSNSLQGTTCFFNSTPDALRRSAQRCSGWSNRVRAVSKFGDNARIIPELATLPLLPVVTPSVRRAGQTARCSTLHTLSAL